MYMCIKYLHIIDIYYIYYGDDITLHVPHSIWDNPQCCSRNGS